MCTVTGRTDSKITYENIFGKGGDYSISSGYMSTGDIVASNGTFFVLEYYSPHRTRGLL